MHMGAVDPNTCRVQGLLNGELAIRQPDGNETDDDDPLKEPHPSTWIYQHIPGGSKRDWDRGIVSKWLRLRFGKAIYYVKNNTNVINI